MLPDQKHLARPSRSDLGQFCAHKKMTSLEEWNRIGCGKLDPANTIGPNFACTLAIMAPTKHFQIRSGMFTV